MKYYLLKTCGLKRKLPVVALGPKLRIASFNLLGDSELVQVVAKEMVKKLKKIDFDCLVGPEVKVVPLVQELSRLLGHKRYIILRKSIKGYMVKPVSTDAKPNLVLNGPDFQFLKNQKAVVIDDVVSTGRTIETVIALLHQAKAKTVAIFTALKQGEASFSFGAPFFYLGRLPFFRR
jgi:adenine phosphoribosyltransferase